MALFEPIRERQSSNLVGEENPRCFPLRERKRFDLRERTNDMLFTVGSLAVFSRKWGQTYSAGLHAVPDIGVALASIRRRLRPGGLLSCTVHHAVWHDLGFDEGFARLEREGALTAVEVVTGGFYESTSDDGRFCLYRRAAA